MIRDLKITYPASTYAFKEKVANALNVVDLERLHLINGASSRVVERENDQDSVWHRLFYEYVKHNKAQIFLKTYDRFVKECIRPLFNEDIVYQKIPTFRVQLPVNKAVGEFHDDTKYGHSKGEINFWVPLTRAEKTAAVWISNGLTPDEPWQYTPLECKPGELLIFDGSVLHGNVVNLEEYTRVSFDFRVIPRSQYRENPKKSINDKYTLDIGSYFSDWLTNDANRF